MEHTRKQHYIPKKILEIFISSNKIYEYLIGSKSVYQTNISNSMCARNIYEHIELDTNLIENFLANTTDSKLPNIIRTAITLIEKGQYDDLYEHICINLYDFLVCYFRSGAVLTELRTSIKENIEDKKIEKFLKIVGNKRYIYNLCKTIVSGYKFALIQSNNDNFILSDQYISTCSLAPKCRFSNVSNRNIGLKETMLLIPITTKYYVVFYHGSNNLHLNSNISNILSEENTRIINNVIYNNSYYKVAFKNKNDLDNINKDSSSIISPMTSIMKFSNGETIGTVTKKEVFLLDKYKEAFDIFAGCQFLDALSLGRNDTCPCGSGKKFKKCCLEKYNLVKNMYTNLKLDSPKYYRINDLLTVEEGIPLIKSDYQDMLDLMDKEMKKDK